MIDIRCSDPAFLVCIKPAGVLSTDEPGGLPELLRETLGDEKACVRTVHRLDRVVSGLMVLARTPEAASELSRQIRAREFDKSYLAVAHVCLIAVNQPKLGPAHFQIRCEYAAGSAGADHCNFHLLHSPRKTCSSLRCGTNWPRR